MIAADHPSPPSSGRLAEASALALRLVQSENALRALTSGQADAIIDAEGRTYLLHPAQEHLRKREGWLAAVLESAADVITVVNRGGEIVFQSSAALRLFGCESGKLVGGNFFSLVHTDDLPRLYAAFFNVIEEFRPRATVEFRHQERDGGYRLVEATVSKLRDVSTAAVVLIFRDTAWRESAQEDAVRREAVLTEVIKAKDRHLAVIAHELGMFIAKGLAEAQQATLSVASAGRGQGTTFRLTFKTIPMMKPENPNYVTKP